MIYKVSTETPQIKDAIKNGNHEIFSRCCIYICIVNSPYMTYFVFRKQSRSPTRNQRRANHPSTSIHPHLALSLGSPAVTTHPTPLASTPSIIHPKPISSIHLKKQIRIKTIACLLLKKTWRLKCYQKQTVIVALLIWKIAKTRPIINAFSIRKLFRKRAMSFRTSFVNILINVFITYKI